MVEAAEMWSVDGSPGAAISDYSTLGMDIDTSARKYVGAFIRRIGA